MNYHPETQLKERLLRAGVALIILWLVILCAKWAPAHDLPDDILSCYGLKGPYIQISEEYLEDGLIEESYTKDDKHAFTTYTIPTPGEDHILFPLFYIIDLNHDAEADIVVVDKRREGKCEQFEYFSDVEGNPGSEGDL